MTERDAQTYQIIGAAMEVHRCLGPGFLEPVYQDALELEFIERKISFRREPLVPVTYKGRILQSYYRPDFICFESVVVELKALTTLSGTERSQVLNYLKATGMQRSVLLNFGGAQMIFERVVRDWNDQAAET